jgi:hypothetical protein
MDPPNQPAPMYTASPIQPAAQQPEGAVPNEKQPFPAQQQQQQFVPVVPVNNAPPRNFYQNATPIVALREFPAVVDCPRCGVREMTVVTPETGNTTK